MASSFEIITISTWWDLLELDEGKIYFDLQGLYYELDLDSSS